MSLYRAINGLLCIAAAVVSWPALAAESSLYQDRSPLLITLTAPHKSLYRARNDPKRPSFDGVWTYVTETGELVELAVGVRSRGNFRRENCRFVPLQINFKKSQVKGTLFKGQDKVKLVGPCGPGARAREWLMLEYLSYQAYAQLTDLHFRTRLLQLTYAEPSGGKSRTDFAFMIESDEDTASRLGAKLIEKDVAMSRLDPEHSALVEVFQFFIGNNDYSTSRAPAGRTCCHNARLLDNAEPGGGLLPVPYDFDHAGIVNASYARAPDSVPGNSVRKRYFTGLCKPDEGVWTRAFKRFSAQREAMVQIFSSELLAEKSRQSALSYVREFYEIIDAPEQARKHIIEHCR